MSKKSFQSIHCCCCNSLGPAVGTYNDVNSILVRVEFALNAVTQYFVGGRVSSLQYIHEEKWVSNSPIHGA